MDKYHNFQEEQLFLNKANGSAQSQKNHVSGLDDKNDKTKENPHLKISGDENSSTEMRINREKNHVISPIPSKREDVHEDNEARIPVVEERLSVNKVQSIIELTITKEPASETTSIEVPITYEEITIQRRKPVNEASGKEQTGEGPVQSNTEIKIPLMKEEIEISKQPYIKEEVIIRKKPVIETRTITEEVKSEKVKVRRGTEEEEEGREGEGREGEEKKEEIIG
jgi:uncharacterized protein (TIGR02271 family)